MGFHLLMRPIIVVVGLFWLEIADFVDELVVHWFRKQTQFRIYQLVALGVELGELVVAVVVVELHQLEKQTRYHIYRFDVERIADFADELVVHWFWILAVQSFCCSSFVHLPLTMVSPYGAIMFTVFFLFV
jgi:hypothetical protein